MQLIRRNPARELWQIRDEMDRLFNHFTSGAFSGEEMPEVDWSPRVDIFENKDKFVLKAELPGMKKEDIKITLQDNVLTLKGEKIAQECGEKDDVHLCERKFGKFMRSFRLNDPINHKKIEASYTDGILTLELPKAEEAKPKEIEIKMN